MYAKEIERAGKLVAGDYELELLVEALADGHRGKELEDVLGNRHQGAGRCAETMASQIAGRLPSRRTTMRTRR